MPGPGYLDQIIGTELGVTFLHDFCNTYRFLQNYLSFFSKTIMDMDISHNSFNHK